MSIASSAQKAPRMSYEQAVRIAREKETEAEVIRPLLEQANAEKAEIEKAGGDLEILRHEVANYIAAIAAERAKTSPDQGALDRMEQEKIFAEVNLGLIQGRVKDVQQKIDALSTQLAELMAALKQPNRVIAAEHRLNSDVPPSIYEADEAHEAVVGAREQAVKRVADHVAMEALTATEAHILPMLQEVEAFLAKFDGAKGRLKFADYPVLDPANVDEAVKAFEILPGKTDAKGDAKTVRGILDEYIQARKALASGSGNMVALVDRVHKAVEGFRRLPGLVGGESQPDRLKARRKDYDDATEQIRRRHQSRVAAAEAKLRESLSESGDRDLLVRARLGEIEVSPASFSTEHPMIEILLNDREAREEYFKKILGKLGVPFDGTALLQALEVRKQDATNNKNPNISEKDLMDQLVKDVMFLLDPSDIKDTGGNADTKELGRRQKRIERLKALGLSMEALKPEELELVLHSVDGGLDPKAAMGELKPKIYAFIGKLKSINDLDDLKAEITARWSEAFDRFDSLLDGSLAKEDKDKGVPKNYQHKEPDHYKKLILDIEGITPGTGPAGGVSPADIAAKAVEKARVEGEVDAFIASVERAAALRKEADKMGSVLAKRDSVLVPALEAVQIFGQVETKFQEIDRVREELFEYLGKRGAAGDDPALATERKVFADHWSTDHATRVRTAETTEKTAKQDLERAERAHRSAEHATDYVRARQELVQLRQLQAALQAGNVAEILVLDKDSRKPLEHAKNIRVGSRIFTGATLIEEIENSVTGAPLRAIGAWAPPLVKQQTVEQLLLSGRAPEVAIAAAYDQAQVDAEPTLELAKWVVEHWNGRNVPGVFFASRKKDATWKVEVMGKAQEVLNALDQALALIRIERRRRPGEDEAAYHSRDYVPKIRETTVVKLMADLSQKLHRPDTADVNAVLVDMFKGLSALTRELTGLEPAFTDKEKEGSLERVRKVLAMIEGIKRNPAVEAELLAAVRAEQSRIQTCINALPIVADALETSAELDIPTKATTLRAKNADIQRLDDDVRAKRQVHTAADTALQTVKAERLDDALVIFDQDTALHIETVIDPGHVLGQNEGDVVNERTAAEDRLTKAQKEVIKFIKNCAGAYKVWLEKKATLVLPKVPPTESEKMALVQVETMEREMFDLFKSHGAPDKGIAADFQAWWDGLSDDNKDKIVNALVPNLL